MDNEIMEVSPNLEQRLLSTASRRRRVYNYSDQQQCVAFTTSPARLPVFDVAPHHSQPNTRRPILRCGLPAARLQLCFLLVEGPAAPVVSLVINIRTAGCHQPIAKKTDLSFALFKRVPC